MVLQATIKRSATEPHKYENSHFFFHKDKIEQEIASKHPFVWGKE